MFCFRHENHRKHPKGDHEEDIPGDRTERGEKERLREKEFLLE
jgi:hypothetical protein